MKLTVFARGDGNREFRKGIVLSAMEMVICAVKRHKAGKGFRGGWRECCFFVYQVFREVLCNKIAFKKGPEKKQSSKHSG